MEFKYGIGNNMLFIGSKNSAFAGKNAAAYGIYPDNLEKHYK
jgi:hypothetical protein